jgi:hypothetical protein
LSGHVPGSAGKGCVCADHLDSNPPGRDNLPAGSELLLYKCNIAHDAAKIKWAVDRRAVRSMAAAPR